MNDPQDTVKSQEIGAMGMYALIVALGVLFAASVVGYLTIRSAHQPWPPPGFPVLPRTLWLSTLAILAASVAIQRALGAVRRADLRATCRGLVLTLGCGLAFLGLQALAWWQVVRQIETSGASGPYVKLFYVLTGLHAVHVLGGLGPLAVVTRRAFAGRYDAQSYAGIQYSAIYWHFLDAVWCVLFVVVYLS
jgi:heme/copper-type cytochrome/quinol oxidase subunit 3